MLLSRRVHQIVRSGASFNRLGRRCFSSPLAPACEDTPFTFRAVTLVGAGKMAEAILDAISAKRLMPMDKVCVYDINRDRLSLFEAKFGCKAATSLPDAVDEAELVVFAVKPQNTTAVFKSLHGRIPKDAVVLSIIAGVPLTDFVDKLGNSKVVRSMPNTPATIQSGCTVWTCTPELCSEERGSVGRLLGTLGLEQYVSDETYLDMATAVSGSGPAYVLLVIEAMVDSAVHMGFPRDMATKLVLQTVLGTTLYAMGSGKHPAILRNDITSPGGTTASALYVLERGAFRTVLSDALWAAYRRCLELGGRDSRVGPFRSKQGDDGH